MAESITTRLGPGNYRRIARRAGLSAFHTSRVLRGIRGCSFDIGCDIAEAAGVTVDQLRDHLKPTRSTRPTRKIKRDDVDA